MKRVACIYIAIMALASCNSSIEQLQSKLHEIKVSPSVIAENSTRGVIVDDVDELRERSFNLYATAYDNGTSADYAVAKATMEYNDASHLWAPIENHKIYWPTSQTDVTFYAWHPASVEPNYHRYKQLGVECNTNSAATPTGGAITLYKEGGDIVHHDASGAAGLQEDLMYCIKTMKNPTQQSVGGDTPNYTVDLEFVHLLTALRFEYKTADALEVRVKGITLHNVKSLGRFSHGYNAGGADDLWWITYDDFDGNLYPETLPNYHCVPMTWGSAEYVSAPTTAVAIEGENDLMLFPQSVTAWKPLDGGVKYSIADNDSGAKRAYLQIYCDIKNAKGDLVIGDDAVVGTSDESMAITPDNCIYVPIGSQNSDGVELWRAGNIVTYTLTFGGGYDKNGDENDDIAETAVSVVVTAKLNDWKFGGDYDIEF